MPDIICPECNSLMVLRETNKFTYPDGTPRKFYGCSNWPKCKATHSAHKDGSPLGIPANKQTKILRIEAHKTFDKLWKNKLMSREYAYAWLAEEMHINFNFCHIGMFNEDQCRQVINICEDHLGNNGSL